jgi:hypothetical protein
MKISYAITVCNEYEEIQRLLSFLLLNIREEDEIVVLFDKKGGTAEVWEYLIELKKHEYIKLTPKTFKNHFADWKNYLTSLCVGDYIFQIDADEMPHETLLNHLPEILESNPNNEVYLVPRINTVEGITKEHINKWYWRMNDKGWLNFPDHQWRIWKNKHYIKWKNKVHEVLDGYKTFATLPSEEEYCLYHPKDIKRQEHQNSYYDTL